MTSVHPVENQTADCARTQSFFIPGVLALLGACITYGIPIASAQAVSATVASIIAAFLAGVGTVVCLAMGKDWFIYYWMNLTILQNAFSGLWLGSSVRDVPSGVTEAKTYSIILAAFLLSREVLNLGRDVRWLRPALVFFGVSVLANMRHVDVVSVATLRNFVLPPLILVVGFALARRSQPAERRRLARGIARLVALWLFVGTVGELLVTTPAWRSIFHAEGLAGLNALSESTVLFGSQFSRAGGLLIEPVNAGYVAASVVVVLVVLWSTAPREFHVGDGLAVAGALVALGAAATKNGLLMFFTLAVGLVALRRAWSVGLMLWAAFISAWVATLLYIVTVKGPHYFIEVFTNPIGASGGETASIHMAGLMSGINGVLRNPVGYGVGSGGNFRMVLTADFDGAEWLATGGESGWGTLAYQAGVVAILGLALVLWSLGRKYGMACSIILAVWGTACLYTESMFGPIASGPLLLAAPLLMRDRQQAAIGTTTMRALGQWSSAVESGNLGQDAFHGRVTRRGSFIGTLRAGGMEDNRRFGLRHVAEL